MDIRQSIDKFNHENPPFYIVDHEDGEYSLCLPLDLLSDEYYPYCQDAFDAYAAEIGEPACKMKRYASRATKLLAIATLICGAVVLIGIIIAVAGVKNIGLPIGFILLGGLLGVIFFACFFCRKKQSIDNKYR